MPAEIPAPEGAAATKLARRVPGATGSGPGLGLHDAPLAGQETGLVGHHRADPRPGHHSTEPRTVSSHGPGGVVDQTLYRSGMTGEDHRRARVRHQSEMNAVARGRHARNFHIGELLMEKLSPRAHQAEVIRINSIHGRHAPDVRLSPAAEQVVTAWEAAHPNGAASAGPYEMTVQAAQPADAVAAKQSQSTGRLRTGYDKAISWIRNARSGRFRNPGR